MSDSRDTMRKASMQKLTELVKLGVTIGTWSIVRQSTPDGLDTWRNATVATPDGVQWSITGGSWNTENKIGVSLAYLGQGNLAVQPRDVWNQYSDAVNGPVDAHISSAKTAEQILKDIQRRVFAHAATVRIGTLMRDKYAEKIASKSTLAAVCETLCAKGFSFSSQDADKVHSMRAYHKGMHSVEVYSDGTIRCEITVPATKVNALLELLK